MAQSRILQSLTGEPIRHKKRVARVLGAALTLMAASGCQSTAIRSDKIPSSLLARPNVNMASMDLPSMGVEAFQHDVLHVGDVVECSCLSGEGSSAEVWEARVDSSGAIDLPYIGPVRVVNQQIALAEQMVHDASVQRQVYRDPTVTLRLKQRQTRRVQVTGAVNEPGPYELPAEGCNLVSVLAAAGGVTDEADQYVEIYDPIASMTGAVTASAVSSGAAFDSNSQLAQRIHIPTAVRSGEGNVSLNDGAVVRIGERTKEYVHVMGNAKQNRSIELPPDREMRLLDALNDVGGIRYSNWICDRVDVTRRSPKSNEKAIIRLSLKEARNNERENILLAPGDVIHVEENPITFTLNTIHGLMGVGFQATSSVARIR